VKFAKSLQNPRDLVDGRCGGAEGFRRREDIVFPRIHDGNAPEPFDVIWARPDQIGGGDH